MSQSQECANNTTLEKYRKILKSNGVNEEIEEVVIKDPGLQGEGMASQPQYVTVKFKDSKIKPLNLFVKVHTPNSKHSEWLEESKLFEKETRFFMEYVPAAKRFCKSKGCDGLIDFYPKCYYGDDTMVVLENLVLERGYVLLKKEVKQDLEATRFAIETLAKHHAISYAFIKEIGGPKPFCERFPNLDFEPYLLQSARDMMDPVLNGGLNTNILMLEKSDVEGKNEAITKLKSLVGKPWSALTEVLKHNLEQEKLLVLIHGDYWNNNMMFLRDGTNGKIIGHVGIDFQMSNYNSPVTDLSYYLYTSVKDEVRQAHLQEMLELYLNTVKEIAQKLGHPVDLTYEEFFSIFRRKFKFGFWFGFCWANEAGLPIMKDIDVNGMENLADYSTQSEKLIQRWIEENPGKALECTRRIVDIVKEYYGLIELQ